MTSSLLSQRGWRIGAIVLCIALALLLVAYLALRWAFPPERLSAILAEEVEAATGRELRIAGELSFRVLPTIALVANGVSLANAPWGSRREMITVRRAAFEVALWPLLRGQVHVLSIDVQDTDVLLEVDARGRGNWMFAPRANPRTEPGASATNASGATWDLVRVVVSRARIAYRRESAAQPQVLVVDSLQTDRSGDRINVAAAFEDGKQRWRLDGTVGPYAALLTGTVDWPFELRLATEGAKLSASGAVVAAPPGTVRAELKARVDNPAALAPWVQGAAALPMPIDLSATVLRGAEAIEVDPLQLSIGGQSIAGRATVHTQQPQPRLEMALASPSIDVSPWLLSKPPATQQTAAGARSPLFSDTPLPNVVLPQFLLQADLRIERLVIPDMLPLAKVVAQIRSDPHRLTAEPLSFAVADGVVHGRMEVEARGREPPRLILRVAANGLSLPALDSLHAGAARFRGGGVNVDANLAMTGNTPHALTSSADGTVLVSLSDVALTGQPAVLGRNVMGTLLDALLPRRESQPLTISCAVVNLPLRNGVATIDRSIALETDQVAVAASGELNLVAQTVMLSFHPAVKKGLGLNPASLAKLVTLQGPLHDPHVGIDMAGTAREAATIGAAVATAGLTLLGSRLIASSDDTQVCRRAAAGSASASGAAPPRKSVSSSSRR